MKKLLLACIICFSFTALSAQQLPISIGVHGGVSNTKMKVDIKNYKSDPKLGYMVGAFARFNISSFYIEPSFNFCHRESECNIFSESIPLKYNAVDIPVMLGLYLFRLPLLKVRAFAGPVASFPGNMKDNALDLRTKNYMWNGKVGAGIDLWKFTFDLDYEKGFSKFENDLKSPRVFNFTFGIKII
ncbi:MAG: porin family protein [Marinifilaceae bacterium]